MYSSFDFETRSEQDLLESLITEAVSMHSEKFFYIPRKLVSPDEVFGEDRLSQFKDSYEIEAYFENISNFDGQGVFAQRYGAFIDYSATLTLVRKHWEERVGKFGKTILPNRPAEGDLIYYPKVDSLFVIKYVDDKNPFAQLGKFYTWKLTIELFQYSSENIETDNNDINAFESLKTFDVNSEKSVWNTVEDIEIVNGGLGYREPPFIHVKSFSGSGAKFEVTLSKNGAISNIEIIDGGMGYGQDDCIEVIGNCTKEAIIVPKIKNKIEFAGDSWGSNTFYQNTSEEILENNDKLFGDEEERCEKSLEEIIDDNDFFIREALKNQ